MIEYVYTIKPVVLASDTRNGWIRGHYDASNVLRRPPSSFWPVKLFSIEAYNFGDLDTCSQIMSDLEELGCLETGNPLFKLRWNIYESGGYLKYLADWCMANVNKTYNVSGSGHRTSSLGASRNQNRSVPVLGSTKDCLCLQSSLFNAIASLSGTQTGTENLKLPLSGIRSTADATAWLERIMKIFTMQRFLCHGLTSDSLQ